MSNTIEGFESLTPQQVFDMSVKHILTTKKKSVAKNPTGKGNVCVYGGSGCGAAVFLTEDAKRAFDKRSSDETVLGGGAWNRLLVHKLVPETHGDLISALQYAHDNSPEDDSFMKAWAGTMTQIAFNFNLDDSAINNPEGETNVSND